MLDTNATPSGDQNEKQVSLTSNNYHGANSSTRYRTSFRTHLKHTKAYRKMYKLQRCVRHYIPSYLDGRRNHEIFQNIETLCLFIGHARSGHSIVGALLDAHPNAVIADEVDALLYISAGFSRDQVYSLLLKRSQELAKCNRQKAGREGKMYSYHVPDQWQGRFNKLQVIGDTRAGASIIQLAENKTLLENLQYTAGDAKLRFIQIIRNPYDNISTNMIRGGRSFHNAIHHYFLACEYLRNFHQCVDSTDLIIVRQEDLIHQPENCLSEMCDFLGLEAATEYLRACTSILYQSPAKSRHNVQWPSELIDLVQSKINEFDFLKEYSYED